MRRIFPLLLLSLLLGLAQGTNAAGLKPSKSRFYYEVRPGQIRSAHIIRTYRRVPVVRPPARVDRSIDPRLFKAATIAQERANARTKARCWQYVKQALLAAGVVDYYPKTNYAYQAATELVQKHGFKKLSVRDPYSAPLGSVLVYGKGSGGAGHVEIRTRNGFVSDYKSKWRCKYPLIGVYAKTG